MTSIARLRAEIDVRDSASPNTEVIERFDTDTLVEILDDQGDFLKINAKQIAHSVDGFVSRLALIFPPPEQQVPIFPLLDLDEGDRKQPSVPANLPLEDFLSWLGSGNNPPWILAEDWGQLNEESAANIIVAIEASINNNPAGWQDWLDSVNASQRLNAAVMDEWIVTSSGGRDMFASRDYFFRQKPSMTGKKIGWVLKGQVVRWTGQIIVDNQNGRQFFEVDFYRRSRSTHGWLRGDILAEYIFPTEQNDPTIASNKENIFDLTQSVFRHPQDSEFDEARQAGRTGAQYLDIKGALDKSLVHFCLCGEICVATLVGSDVIPVLRQWRNSGYWRADAILKDRNQGTSLGDIRSILKMFDRDGENYNSTPVSAQFVKDKLADGSFAISGCCITRSGKVKRDAKIRHWVIVEDVVPVGSSGWVRVYNPFQNQEEVYDFDTFLSSTFSGTGMWIQPVNN
jgi:hypothetical protein